MSVLFSNSGYGYIDILKFYNTHYPIISTSLFILVQKSNIVEYTNEMKIPRVENEVLSEILGLLLWSSLCFPAPTFDPAPHSSSHLPFKYIWIIFPESAECSWPRQWRLQLSVHISDIRSKQPQWPQLVCYCTAAAAASTSWVLAANGGSKQVKGKVSCSNNWQCFLLNPPCLKSPSR